MRSEHGWVTVTTETVNDTVQLTVENTGPPVPPEEVPSLFQPFRRLPATERLADSPNPLGEPRSRTRTVDRAGRGERTWW